MKKIKIILLFAVSLILFRPVFAEAAQAPEYGSLTIYNRSTESELVSGVEYTIWQVDESSSYRPDTPEDAKEHLLQSTRQSKLTDNEGKVVFSSLPAGIYYVTESDLGDNSKAAFVNPPFLVEIPMTNEEGTGWIADIEVYLKNQVLGIDKFVNGAGVDNYDTEDVNNAKHRPVGGEELYGYSIVSYFPGDIGTTVGESYVVTDQINDYVVSSPETLKVYSVPDQSTAVQKGYLLTEGQHYEKVFDSSSSTLTVSLTDAGMDLLNERSETEADQFLLIKFDSRLSEDVPNGTNIYGKASLTYQKGTAQSDSIFSLVSTVQDNTGNLLTVSVADEPEVHTGQIGITKVSANNEEQKLENAKFGISLSEADAQEGDYISKGSTDENGNLIFRGLSYGQLGDDSEQNSNDTTFWLTEIEAPSGYSRVSEPIEVKFQYQQGDDGEFYFAKVTVYNQPTGTTTTDKSKTSNSVKTGDVVSVLLIAVILIISLMLIIQIIKKKKRFEK